MNNPTGTQLCDNINRLMARVPLTENEFKKISALIYQRAGIVLADNKRDMVYNRLSRRLRALNLDNFSQYLALLESHSHSEEWQSFINALTTNLTAFYRESYHFPILAEHARARKGNYTVWSTAASTGEEPCSIAITLDEVLGRSVGGPRIWATDIDTEVLETASRGIYRQLDIAKLTEVQKKKYFLRGTGNQEGKVRVRPELLSSIQYQALNLLDANWNVPGPFDAIFCRNVMIYFDKETQGKILRRFAGMLKEGGVLFAGHSEHVSQLSSEFYLQGQSVYGLTKDK
ncbi:MULTISPECIES: protein-glutamate O-methyltransferase CheR [Tenebrionibacter/Tenebrionicola group]|jgi:chemotaxis protein methyltransferase CheR|uniref:Chemotaxis protein methyltransferase n=2 Tax=Tenebrionibacter/Tenebrionicola group TaxID=2969848 RepID=A0A8K0V7F3_9ENTR|nr:MULTISPECIES: protein-glutamate O-methyltransferase CheR [Tenebrionibacter/Tenebrionicola group]MBK4716743.1 protein-glutamate O-methyltransferase CheR [Tenebrionibacter intestinalis]MBV4414016.1 protein-glutamate O-methyltransferase CheR [Tenebrionicola larvae]MBV5096230.1 protein-glutamate O-methyltransferase CheR [Tenebrionicola larvae]